MSILFSNGAILFQQSTGLYFGNPLDCPDIGGFSYEVLIH